MPRPDPPTLTAAEILAEGAGEPDEWTDAETELWALRARIDEAKSPTTRRRREDARRAAMMALYDRLDAYRPRIPERARHSIVPMLMWVRADPEQRKVMFTRQWFAERERSKR